MKAQIEEIMTVGSRAIIKKVMEKDKELAEDVGIILCLMSDYINRLQDLHTRSRLNLQERINELRKKREKTL